MASDSIKRISETEEQALQIEREADSAAAVLLADAESAASVKLAKIDRETYEEVQRILSDAEEARIRKEQAADLLAREESEVLRTRVSPRMPDAIAAVRDLIIGKV